MAFIPTFEQLCKRLGYDPKNRPLSPKELADFIGVHRVTVDQFRVRGDGPRFFKPSGTRRVWYSEYDVLMWLVSGEKQSTSETTAE